MKKILNQLYSTRLMAVLFLVFAIAMAVATFVENDYGTETAKALIYSSWWFELIMVFMAINFFGNIFKYKLYRKEKWVVLAFHLSFVLIIIGAGVTRYISFEGIMPIKEGQTSSVFLSEKIFIGTTVDDGENQKTPNYDAILLSAMTSNSYAYSSDFKGKEFSVKLTGYTPNFQESFTLDETGDTYIKFVESSSGGRHDHYIKQGTSQSIHGLTIGFDTDAKNAINFKTVDGVLKINTVFDGTYYRMADQYNGIILKDTLQDFSLLSLYRLGNSNFVVPSPSVKGKYIEKSAEDRTSFPTHKLTFDVTVDGVTETVAIKGAQYTTYAPIELKVNGLNFRLTYGSKQLSLPFSIKLRDFQLEKYPGSTSPMSFASEITVIDPEETFDFKIFMNNILIHRGYKFFQASYEITDEYEETRLSVNHDYWGTLITYIGYFLLYGAITLTLFMKKTRFGTLRAQLRKIKSTKAATVIAIMVVASTSMFGQNHTTHRMTDVQIDSALNVTMVSKTHAAKFSKLVIQDRGGRMKPVHTFASELLRKVSKSEEFRGYDAGQVFLSITKNPRLWFQVPIIYIKKENTKLREIIGIAKDAKHAPLASFFDDKGGYKLIGYQEDAVKKKIKSKFEESVINVDRRLNLLYSAVTGSILRIFPLPNDPENTWITQMELRRNSYPDDISNKVIKMMPVYLGTLDDAVVSGDYEQSDAIIEGIRNFQKKYGASVIPTDKNIDLEIAYNKYDVFKKLYSYYMGIGVLLFFLVIFQIFKDNKVVRILIKVCIAIIIGSFLMHTGGLIARWMISGHAPWSNAYESMIYVAWATMLFGLIFGRKSALTLGATAFLTSFILMIAHWSWMDPAIANLQPVLNSYWLMVHVAIIVASYGPLALGMILGLISLILMILTTKNNKKHVGEMIKELTIITEMTITVGVILLTIGNFLGGQWANESWGRYWGWDPKETWALITIMIYAFILHLRLVPGLRGRYTFNFFAVLGFASVMMTYFGVNFYLSGLHSYASGSQAITPDFVYYCMSIFTVIAVLAFLKFKKYYKK
ncbi:MAG: c-type cytochrome biogenesis protein CcsB [Flavobacteriaceae bacterium]|nr:MAG: c-type cytochrome biogenesis protein CcsB [Flavobacteriaceae bacterium]